MRRAALIALAAASLSGCAAVSWARGGGGMEPDEQLAAGIQALQAREHLRARGLLEPLFREYPEEPEGQRAMLALIAAELDPRNPERRLWAGADMSARLLNVPGLEPWMVPVAESFYVLANELGAQEERIAQADSARAAAEARVRSLPRTTQPSVPARIAEATRARDEARREAEQLQARLAEREKELRETKQELERIKRTIKS